LLVTPPDYEPPGFQQAASDRFSFEVDPMNIKVGDVVTVCINTNISSDEIEKVFVE